MIVKRDKANRAEARGNGGGLPTGRRRGGGGLPQLGHATRSLLLAVVLAILAFVLILLYVRGYRADVQGGAENATVLVATRDIPAGAGGGSLAEDAFEERTIPRRLVVPGAVSDPAQIRTRVVQEPIYAGEQVSTRRFGAAEARGVRGQLEGNLRAMRVIGTADQVLAGILSEGDRVDVVASVRTSIGGARERPATRVILRDLLVLEAPPELTAEGGLSGGEGGAAAVLALTDGQAQRLFFATRNGEWSLILRAPADASDSPESTTTAESLVAGGGGGQP